MSTFVGRWIRRATIVGLAGATVMLLVVPAAGLGAPPLRDCSEAMLAPGARLQRCDLPDLVITGQDLHAIDLSRSNLVRLVAGCNPDLPRTNLTDARLAKAVLTDARLCDAILREADLRGTDLAGGDFEDALLDDADLSMATLDGANAHFASFVGVNLSDASWSNGAATNTWLDQAKLRGLDWTGTNATGARLVGADLRRARLDGVNFTDADLTGADWRHASGAETATWSNTTCPDGTNSDANGGTCVGH